MNKPEDLLLTNGPKKQAYDADKRRLSVFVPKGEAWRTEVPGRLVPYLSDEVIANLHTLEELENFIQGVTEQTPSASPELFYRRHSSDRPAKKLREEVWPWLHFLRVQSFGKTCRFAFQPHGAQADVVLTMEAGEQIPVQITQAVDGEQEARRMEALTYNRFVSGTATITKGKKTPSGYNLEWLPEMSRVDDDVTKIEDLVKACITKKHGKDYPKGTWLLVDIEECSFARWGDKHVNRVIGTAKALGKDTSFSRIYLLNGETCWQVK